MKRKPSTVRAIWTLLSWSPCYACGLDFRREPGWYAQSEGHGSGDRWVCASCAPTREAAEQILAARRPLPTTLPTPPPMSQGTLHDRPFCP